MKSLKNIFLVSSSNRCHRKSGKKARNQADGVDGACSRFRKPGTRKMKSRKTGEYARVGSRLPHGLHSRPLRGCGKSRRRVQSAVQCKPDAGREASSFPHGIHPGALDARRNPIALGCFHPEFLMAIVRKGKAGDASVGTLLKCDAGSASTGIEKPVGKLR
jgi:hypothetical protein